jgi:hypothetical protein
MGGETMGRRRRIALLIVGVAHLGLVAVGALKVHFGDGWGSRTIAVYAALSGAENFYTFFTPGVGTQIRPIFEVKERSGDVITDVLKKPESSEVDLRVGDLYGVFWWEDEELHHTLLASWAGTMFTRHPGAEEVVVCVEACDVPSMEEYRDGDRPAWHLVERTAFSRGEIAREARP